MIGYAHVPVTAGAGKRELGTVEGEVVQDDALVRGTM